MKTEGPDTKKDGISDSPGKSAEKISSRKAGPRITYSFPVTINHQVKKYISLFQQDWKPTFKKWLERSSRYLPLIEEKLDQSDLPLDLAYLPLIESGYSLTAYSRSHAAGLWQFIESTARHYGLQINSYIDERRNPLKSTDAAIRYLSDLYEEFGDWQLAVAAYNTGRYKIIKGIRRYNSKDFWELAEKNYLYNETKEYVPKLIAAIVIAKNPEKYGFNNLNYASPFAYDTIKVKPWTSLHKISLACDTDLKKIKELNRDLKRQLAPPGNKPYEIKIPAGTKKLASRNLPRIHAIIHTRYKTHVAQKDETLSEVCRRYNLNKTTVLKANNLKSARLKKNQRLRIPYQTKTYAMLDTPPSMEMAAEDGFILHRIEGGETLSHISLKYRVPVHQIAAWNGLNNVHNIRAGDKLALYITEDNPSIPHIARNRTNKQQLALVPRHYTVKKGDSLWEISRRYNISVEQIKSLNNLQDNLIHPETRLVLKKEQPGG
ncbi:MAG: LysM peptidoglycan-binding domain-containing protein [Thermodesulfobacteriota bacterium]